MGASEYLLTIHGLTIGEPPHCDPARERRLIDVVLEAIATGVVASAHDCSDGGLAVALAESAIIDRDTPFGFAVDLSSWSALPARALLFGEAHGRVVISTADPARVVQIAARHDVPATQIGVVTAASSGAQFTLAGDSFSAPISWLSRAFHEAIPLAMDGATPAEHAVVAGHAPLTD